MDPYLTILIVSYGGPTSYTIEYGRLDERGFSYSSMLKPLISMILVFIIVS